eukprot:5662149-Prymnesium_polylepis.1
MPLISFVTNTQWTMSAVSRDGAFSAISCPFNHIFMHHFCAGLQIRTAAKPPRADGAHTA